MSDVHTGGLEREEIDPADPRLVRFVSSLEVGREERFLDACAWPLTRVVAVRDPRAEVVGGPPVMRVLLVSAFCPQCARRRGEQHPKYVYESGVQMLIGTESENPCGHVDTYESLRDEVELQCAYELCVLMTSDAFYPYCSADCSGEID